MSGSSREQDRPLIMRFMIWFPKLAAHMSGCLVRRTQIVPSCKAITPWFASITYWFFKLNHGIECLEGGGKDLLLPKSFSQSTYCLSPPLSTYISGHINAHLSFVNISAASQAPCVLLLFVSPASRGSLSSSSHPLSMLMALLWLAGH